ncbi:hypothetical protein [Haloarchaeobius baliensis]|uniref:hypothetical protein n=1 Tax=Haloarchaeobius baliensis TaxID=1670458 RepID=UPI003F883814
MTTSRSRARALLALLLVTFVLAGSIGPVGAETGGAETTSATAERQSRSPQLELRASVTGDIVVVAGWFELTASAEGRVDTTTGAREIDGTYDVNLAEPFGEFEYSGEVVGTVNASRVLLVFEGNATSFAWAESAPPATALSSVGGAVATVDRMPRQSVSVQQQPTPLQLRPFRSLGISFFDLYWELATLLLGLVVVGLLPRFSRHVSDLGTSDPLRTAAAGLAVVLAVPVALLMLGLSLFGIPLALAGTAVYLVFWWLGAVFGRFTVGLWVLGAVSQGLAAVDIEVRRVENRWAGLLVGTFVVGLLVLLPFVGPVIESLVLLLGLGGVTRLAYRSYRRTERGERTQTVGSVIGSEEE